ncbi:MAG: branched-chain amino acid ABC transporter permease [Clostridiaceae bacterium]|nr:branched-chain amino acid ABC transporter permease [Clostridiaceae bacterium]NBI84032.1 branched-chain amino acid ABC transporter permease [Clostridiaceae bacterium]RKJ79167.1 branched-chain amino acid ABC transporter permease [Butyricicoccus sp. 1XD8-22]
MQVTITPQAVITAASLLAALGSLGGMAAWWVRFIDRDKRQDAELKAIRREQTLLCYGMTACLKGMKEQGCNGPVTTALDKLEKHLNQAAHDEEV